MLEAFATPEKVNLIPVMLIWWNYYIGAMMLKEYMGSSVLVTLVASRCMQTYLGRSSLQMQSYVGPSSLQMQSYLVQSSLQMQSYLG